MLTGHTPNAHGGATTSVILSAIPATAQAKPRMDHASIAMAQAESHTVRTVPTTGTMMSDDRKRQRLSVEESIDRILAARRREEEIHCPHCDAIHLDEDHALVSMWGEWNEPPSAICGTCERDFLVYETIRRTYETTPLESEDDGSDQN